MQSKYLIYGLMDPKSKWIRYIGRSCTGLKRPREHSCPKNLATKKTHCVSWIKSLGKKVKPHIVVLATANSQEELDALEVETIALARALDFPLTNHTDGGGGTRNFKHSEEAKAKIAEACSKEKHPQWKGGLPNCADCGTQLKTYAAEKCRACCVRVGVENPSYISGLPNCKTCSKELKSYHSEYCSPCLGLSRRKTTNCIHCGVSLSSQKAKTCKKCKNIRPIEAFGLDDKIMGEWSSAKACSEELGLNYNKVWSCLTGSRATHKRLKFRYKECVSSEF